MAFNFKIVLVGDGGVGKTTYVKRIRSGMFERKYLPTMGVDVQPLTFETNYGKVIFKVWDCAGQEKFGGLRDGYYLGADGAICMFDLSSRVTCKNVSRWIVDVKEVVPNIPIIICSNKTGNDDPYDPLIEDNYILEPFPSDTAYYNISAKSNYDLAEPFLDLARKLTGHEDLEFIKSLPIDLPKKHECFPGEGFIPLPEVKAIDCKKKICWMAIPGNGMMKITYEFFNDGEVIEQS